MKINEMSIEDIMSLAAEDLPALKKAVEKILDAYGKMCVINYKISLAQKANQEVIKKP